MGSDIHLFIEYVVPARAFSWANEIFIGRDYPLFGKLAGIRSAEVPLVAPRGLPFDVSYDVFANYYSLVVEKHSAWNFRGMNFVTEDEAASLLKRGVSHRPPAGIKTTEVTSELEYVSNPDWHSPSWLWCEEVLSAVSNDIITANAEFHVVVDTLQSIEHHMTNARSRIVFWFDN
jgi:hypothetical protein